MAAQWRTPEHSGGSDGGVGGGDGGGGVGGSVGGGGSGSGGGCGGAGGGCGGYGGWPITKPGEAAAVYANALLATEQPRGT